MQALRACERSTFNRRARRACREFLGLFSAVSAVWIFFTRSRGLQFFAIFDIGNGGNGAKSRLDRGGLYNDVYVKTESGWRFKTRAYYESKSGEPVQPPPALIGAPRALAKVPVAASTTSGKSSTKGPSLTVEDYIDIQQLVSRYPYALDVDPDEGASYAKLFTPDAVFRQPRTEGREALAKLAASAPHGPQFVRHFITNHVIDPTPDGATGKEYLVVIDIGENGMPSSIFLGGHYDDVYARTPEGWRFKTRTFVASASAPPASPAAPSRPAPTEPGR